MSQGGHWDDGKSYWDDDIYWDGDDVLNKRLMWLFEVDWFGNDEFLGDQLETAIFDLESRNGRNFWLNPVSSQGISTAFYPMQVGNLTLSIRDQADKYDAYNTSSPLYGELIRGKKFRLRVYDVANDVLQPVMTGRILNIQPSYDPKHTVKITAQNEIADLQKVTINTPVQSTIRFDEAIKQILLGIGWMPTRQDINTTVSDAMTYWWASGGKAWDELGSIVDAVSGLLCVSEEGNLKYKSRISSDVALATIADTDAQLADGIQAPIPEDIVRNVLRVYSRARTLTSNVVIWSQAGAPVQILPGGSLEIWTNFSYQGLPATALNITTPVSAKDYSAFANSDGSGANYTSSVSIAMTKWSTTTKEVITNIGANSFYLFTNQIRGDIIVADQYTFVQQTDPDSIKIYGEIEMDMQSNWLQDPNTATDVAVSLLPKISSAKRFPRLKIRNNPLTQFNLKLTELVGVNIATKNLSGYFRVGYVHHKFIDEYGDVIETEVYLEPNILTYVVGTWIFPASLGVTTVFA